MAKRFFYVSFGILCLVAAYHVGAEQAEASPAPRAYLFSGLEIGKPLAGLTTLSELDEYLDRTITANGSFRPLERRGASRMVELGDDVGDNWCDGVSERVLLEKRDPFQLMAGPSDRDLSSFLWGSAFRPVSALRDLNAVSGPASLRISCYKGEVRDEPALAAVVVVRSADGATYSVACVIIELAITLGESDPAYAAPKLLKVTSDITDLLAAKYDLGGPEERSVAQGWNVDMRDGTVKFPDAANQSSLGLSAWLGDASSGQYPGTIQVLYGSQLLEDLVAAKLQAEERAQEEALRQDVRDSGL